MEAIQKTFLVYVVYFIRILVESNGKFNLFAMATDSPNEIIENWRITF